MKLSKHNNKKTTLSFHRQPVVATADCKSQNTRYPLTSSTTIRHYQDKWLIVRKAEIKHLVFAGGGAKGVVYPGVIKAFEDYREGKASMRDSIDSVSGSSIGAITAAIVASGLSADDYMTALAKEEFTELLGPSWKPIHKSGAPLLAFLRHNIYQGIKQSLADWGDVYQTKPFQALAPNDRLLLDALARAFELNRPIKITFAHLSALRRFDPRRFKSLAVTAVRRSNGEITVFDDESTPDLEIATACLASAALPLIVKPVKIEKRLLGESGEGYVEFVDGGYFNNIPVNIPDMKHGTKSPSLKGEQGQDLQTLVMVFESNSHPVKPGAQSPFLNVDRFREHVFIHTSRLSRLVRNDWLKYMTGMHTAMKNTKQEELDSRRVNQKYTQRNIPLNTLGVGIMNFDKAQKKTQSLYAKGAEQTRNYLRLHRGELSYYHYDDLISLMLHLRDDELDVLHQSGLEAGSMTAEKIKAFRELVALNIAKVEREALVSKCGELCEYIAQDCQDASPFYQYIVEQFDKHHCLFSLTDVMERGTPLSEYLMAARKQQEIVSEKKEIITWLNHVKKKGFNGINHQLLTIVREKVIKANDFDGLEDAMKLIRDFYQHRFIHQPFVNSVRGQPHTIDQAETKLKQLVEKRIELEPVEIYTVNFKMSSM